jgi:hypothetical protein
MIWGDRRLRWVPDEALAALGPTQLKAVICAFSNRLCCVMCHRQMLLPLRATLSLAGATSRLVGLRRSLASTSFHLNLRIQPFELDARAIGGELPIDTDLIGIASLVPCRCLVP